MIYKMRITIEVAKEIEAKTEEEAERKLEKMFEDGNVDFYDEGVLSISRD